MIGTKDQHSVLVVGNREQLAEDLRKLYPQWQVRTTESPFVAIRELSQEEAGLVVMWVDPSNPEVGRAVAGVRQAAGAKARLLLCCAAEAEPATREAVGSGADDYVLYPFRREDLDAFLAAPEASAADRGVVESVAELEALGEVVTGLDAPLDTLLQALARWVQAGMNARAARVAVEDLVQTSGDPDLEPDLVEPLVREGRTLGHVAVGGKRTGDYVPADTDRLRHYVALIGHIVAAGVQHRRWHELAYIDELSRLPNRRYLLETLHRLLKRPPEEQTPVTVLMFDIDNFKSYNDTYGHDAGDEIIRGCGQLFRHNCRENDVVTRYGGDEFAVVFWDDKRPRVPGSRHPTTVLPIIERCRRSLRDHRFASFQLPEHARLTISGGLATFPADAPSVEELIRQADEALLRAKREGKNCIYLGGDNGGPALGD